MKSTRLKCKFCDWSTVKGFMKKDGKFSGIDKAHQRLLSHVEYTHHVEYRRVRKALDELPEEV